MSYLLDTCVLSEITKLLPDPGVIEWLSNRSAETMYVSVLTFGEIQHGVARLPESEKKRILSAELDKLYLLYKAGVLDVDLAVARTWGELRAAQDSAGARLPVIDSMIAATALIHHLTVVTRNTSDFTRSGCRVLNIWGSA